jgi:hypothetical protein
MATRMQQRRGTAAQWTSANPVLNAGEMGWESDTNKFKIGDGTNHWADLDYFADINSTVNPAFGSSITFEGATADSYETVLQVTDPTADRTITLPNATGTVVLADATQTLSNKTLTSPIISTISNSGTLTLPTSTGTIALTTDIPAGVVTETGTQTLTNKTITGLVLSDGSFVVEGATADAYETTVQFTDPTADRTITIPDATGTVALTGNVLALSGGTMSGAIAMGTSKITGLGAPTDPNDAATKTYVDSIAEGLHIHESVVAATTANITLATDVENGDTLDGVTLATGNRILVKNQSTASENGIYVVAASGAPSRAADFDTAAEIDGGDFVFVTGGTVNDNTGYVQVNTVGTVGTDAISFVQFSGAGTYTAGTGLSLAGTVFSINTATTVDLSTAQSLSNKTLASAVATTALTLNATAELRLADTDSSHYVGFKAPGTVTTNRIWTLPSADGTTGQFLSTDGSGALSWTSPSSGGAAFSEFMLIGA